jgi:hypothetical protein
MLKNSTDYPAMIQFLTISAGVISFFVYTFSDFTEVATKESFWSVYAATHAIDHGCYNLDVIQSTPLPGGLSPQLIVIIDRGYASIATFAIQSATSN